MDESGLGNCQGTALAVTFYAEGIMVWDDSLEIGFENLSPTSTGVALTRSSPIIPAWIGLH